MKKRILLLILIIIVPIFGVLVVGGVILCKKGDYVLYTVTADIEGTPVELKDRYLNPGSDYEDYEHDSVSSIGYDRRLNNGFRVFEIRRLSDVPAEYYCSADFEVDGMPVDIGVVLADPVDPDADPWITDIHISFYYDESGELQQTVTCSKGIIYEIDSFETYGSIEVEYAPLAYEVRTDKNTKIYNVGVYVKNN